MLTTSRFVSSLLFVFLAFSTVLAQDEKAISPTQAAPTVTAAATGERVRFTAPSTVVRLQLEVLSDAGQFLFDASTKGNVLDWTVQDSAGQHLRDGSYLCVVTVKSLSGSLRQKIGLVVVHDKQLHLQAADATQLTAAQQQAVGPLEQNSTLTFLSDGDAPAVTVTAHDGTDGQLTRGRGALSFRMGDFFSGKDVEQMRLTEEGDLGIGTDSPQARLDVNGMIRVRQGIQFSDGSLLNLSPSGGGLRFTLPSGATTTVNLTPHAPASINKIPKFTDGGGTLGDSALSESNGFIGWGTDTPQHPFTVRRNGGSAGVHSFGELYVDRDDRTRSASLIVGTGGVLKWIFGMPYQSDGFQVYDLIANQTRFFVDPSNGNIGIGTQTPAQKLEVAGNMKLTGVGNGLIFPDGTMQITASSGGGGGSGVTAANYVFSYATFTQGVGSDGIWASIIFDQNAQINGWIHPVNGPSFNCGQTGLYLIQYAANVGFGGNNNRNIEVRAVLNDVEIQGSQLAVSVFPVTNVVQSVFPVSKSFIASISSGDALKIQFVTSTGQGGNIFPVSGRAAASITIIRIQ